MTRSVKIVLPCRNECEWLRTTVDSILETTDYEPYGVFVLANGDTQTDFSFLEERAYAGKVSLRVEPEPLGVGGSINAAVEPGDADVYVFLDAHCFVEGRDWLQQAVDCLETHRDVSMVQPEVVQFTYDGTLDAHSGFDARRVNEKSYAYSIAWSWPYERATSVATVNVAPDRDTPYEAMAGGGMCSFVRSEVFHRLGGYDPEVPGWFPETMDYCIRGWLLGLPMMVHPGVRIRHRLGDNDVALRHLPNVVHGVLRTAYKYLSPRRRDMAEILFRRHGLDAEVDRALARIHAGRWLEERVEHLDVRVHDDDWLFSKFDVHEERYGIRE